MSDDQVLGATAALSMLSPMASNRLELQTDMGLKALTVEHSISD